MVCLSVCLSVSRDRQPRNLSSQQLLRWATLWQQYTWPEKSGAAVLLYVRESGSPSNSVAWTDAYLRSKWYPDSSSRLATVDMGRSLYGRRLACVRKPRKWGGLMCPLRLGEMGPHLTQCGLGRGLSAYQVAS